MNLRIRRRRFGQLAIASAATAAIANLAGKTQAQTSEVLFGVSLGEVTSSAAGNDITAVASSTPQLVITSLNLVTGVTIATLQVAATTVKNITSAIGLTPKATSSGSLIQRITGLSTLVDGTLVSTIVSHVGNAAVTTLVFNAPGSSQPQNSLTVTGLPSNGSVESLVATTENNLIGLISRNGSSLPFELATIDRTTGNLTSGADSGLPSLDPNRGYGTLAKSPNGTIYIVTIGREGTPELAQVNQGSKSINSVVRLSYNGKPLGNGLLSLAVSSSDQLYALANLNYQETNSLFTIDRNTGVMTLVRSLDADQIAISRA